MLIKIPYAVYNPFSSVSESLRIIKILLVVSNQCFFGRSPWSNKYHPPLEDGPYPSSDLRKLEIEANDVFAVYCDQ